MKTKTFISEFDSDTQVAILCKDDYRYDVLKPIFDKFGFGFVSVENKLVCIDGEVKLSKNELKWVEAHEAAHIRLKHTMGERDAEDEACQERLSNKVCPLPEMRRKDRPSRRPEGI